MVSRKQNLSMVNYQSNGLFERLKSELTIVVRTDIRGFFTYVFYEYLDPRADSTVDGMQYEGEPLVNCSMFLFEFIQPLADPFQVEVSSLSQRLLIERYIFSATPRRTKTLSHTLGTTFKPVKELPSPLFNYSRMRTRSQSRLSRLILP